MNTLKGNRLHIGFFGKTNAGKSTIVNEISGQDLSIVSDIKGTTTDVNEKTMELLPVGPVVLLDTAGIDDISELGLSRIEKTKKALSRCDIAVFVCDNKKLNEFEKKFLKEIKIPIIAVLNKTDIGKNPDFEFLKENSNILIKRDKNFINTFKEALLKILPDDFINQKSILNGFVKPFETCILVIPIDKEAPKGRIILPQVNTLRELLDNNAITMVCTDNGLEETLNSLKILPKLVICDSQVFKKVDKITPDNIPLTSFSILFARLKGDLASFYEGSKKIDDLHEMDKILILESCTHHPVEDDIGRVKIPHLLRQYTKKELIFEHFSGHDIPEKIDKYSLVIHCGACMTNRREILNRINLFKNKAIPITNYGIAIAKCTGILDRAIAPLIKT